MLLLLLLSRFSRVRLCATPETAAHQAPPSMGFSRQCIFDLYPQVLTHRPQNPWNFISVESDKVIFYVNEVTVKPTMKGLEILILLPTSREGRRAGS